MDPYIGEIRIFAGTFAPVGWHFCDGALLPISEYDTLYVLIGTTYGGDGQTTFGLPDLRGRLPVHQGAGPGLSNRVLGQAAGAETVTLTGPQLPRHTHPLVASTAAGDASSPSGKVLAQPPSADLYIEDTPSTSLAPASVLPVGANLPHENMPPYLAVNYIISLYGIFPSQS